jgi:predicted ATPase/DNA-binding SARP family transcriptional activator
LAQRTQRIEFGLLGPLVVTRDGRQLEFAGTRSKSLLALLALEPGRVVAVDRLVDEIWGAHPPVEPVNALQAQVSRLRRALSPDNVVASRPPGYLLAVEPEQVDAVRFERLISEGHAAAGSGLTERAAQVFRAALALWRGAALADFPEVPAARAAAARLEELRLNALEERIEADLASGRHPLLVGELQRLVAEHPLRERLHAQLMRALYATGRQADALAAYQRARAALAEEAGLDPGPELRRLERRLLHQDPALIPAAPARATTVSPVAVPAAAQVPSNVPMPLTTFVGRADLIAEIRAHLGRGRLVTLVGPGGVGKTRLAVEVARRRTEQGHAGRDGTWLAELAPVRDPALLAGAVLDALGAQKMLARPDSPSAAVTAGATDRLLRALAGRELLLILDNCEHLVEAVAELAEAVLATCPGVRLLATSREALRVPGETRVPVPPLPLPLAGATFADADELVRYGACRLFVERAAAVCPGYTVGRSDVTAVVEICRRLDGLPLAIELAAARVNVMSVREMAGRLGDRFRLLTAGARTSARHRTLRAVVDWSWELLTPGEQVVLRRLAVFVGGCTLRAAERVCGGMHVADRDVAVTIAGLVEKSLLEVRPGPVLPAPSWPGIERADLPAVPPPPAADPRYHLFDTVRVYALERLAEAGETDDVAGTHAAWCVEEVAAAQLGLHGSDQLAWWTRVHAELGNLRAALSLLLDRGDAIGAVRVSSLLAWHLTFFGHRDQAASALRAALALPGGINDRDRAGAMATLAWLSLSADGIEEFERWIEAAAAAFLDAGERAHAELITALEHDIARRKPNEQVPAASSTWAEAGDALDAVLAEGRWTQVTVRHVSLAVLSSVFDRLGTGEVTAARRIASAWLTRLRNAGDRQSMIDSLELLAGIEMAGDRPDEAEGHLREALRLACELRFPIEMAVQLAWLGDLELWRGNLGPARAHLEQALAACRQYGVPDVLAGVCNGLGLVNAAEGDDTTARAWHEQAWNGYRQLGDEVGGAVAQALLGLVSARGGETDRARILHRESLDTALRTGNAALASLVLEVMALVAADAGDGGRTALLLGAAHHGDRGRGLGVFDLPGLAASLPPFLLDQSVAVARRAIGDEAFDAGMRQGRDLGADRITALAG